MARIPLGALTTLNTALHLDPMFIELYTAAGGDFSSAANFVYGSGAGAFTMNINSGNGAAQGSALQFKRAGVANYILGEAGGILGAGGGDVLYYSYGSVAQRFYTNATERGRLTGSGEWAFGSAGGTGARLNVAGGTLPTSSNGLNFSATLSAGRLSSGDTSNGTAVVNGYADSSIIEISAGTTAGYTSGIVMNGRAAVVNPGTVQIYTFGAMRCQFDSAGNTTPGADNAQTLGSASRRWSTVYAGTGTINTSDAREKTEVAPLTDAELNAASTLAREIGSFHWLSSIAEKGEDSARIHIGLTVQRAIEIMSSNGLEPMRYAFICYDEWEEKVTPEQIVPAVVRQCSEVTGLLGPNGEGLVREWEEVVEPERVIPESVEPAGNRYGFRYDQLALFIMRGQEERLRRLEARP